MTLWEIINTEPVVPRCVFCAKTTNQMARFTHNIGETIFICSSCARFVKDCMNEWKDLKSTDYIPTESKWDWHRDT